MADMEIKGRQRSLRWSKAPRKPASDIGKLRSRLPQKRYGAKKPESGESMSMSEARTLSEATALADSPAMIERVKLHRAATPYKQRRAAGETALRDRHEQLADLMVLGLEVLDPRLPDAAIGQPLTLSQAATALGLRQKNARQIFALPAFKKLLNEKTVELRTSAHPRMIRNMIDIANDRGENTAADRTVQLKAAVAVLGEQAKGPTVNVQVNNQTNTTIRPGYVLDLSALHGRRHDEPVVIEADVGTEGNEAE